MTPRKVWCVAVFAAALVVYLPALDNGFAYDDVAIIKNDPRVHSLGNTGDFFRQGYWADSELALYRPLTTLTFAIDWALADGAASWFILVNALWNAAASTLVFLLLSRFSSVTAAGLAALVFAVHPVHVEAVANVVGRAELIVAVLSLTALLLWPRPGTRPTMIFLIAGLFGAALLAKESAIMLPALLVLVDIARRDLLPANSGQWLRARLLPFALFGAVGAAYMVLRAGVLGGVAPSRLDAALEVTAGAERLLTALQAWPQYLRLLVAPLTLLADYGPRVIMPAQNLSGAAAAGLVILTTLIIAGVVAWSRGHGPATLALLWFPVAILPVSNLIVPIGIIVAERTLYLPSMALAVGIALVLDATRARPPARLAAAAAVIIIAALFATRTVIRIPDWRSTDAIFAALLRDRPDSFRGHWHQARLAAVAGRTDEALSRYVHAVELWPYRERLMLETIRASIRANRPVYARQLAAYAEDRWPRSVEAARLHAAITIDMGDTATVRLLLDSARERFPNDSMLLRMSEAIR